MRNSGVWRAGLLAAIFALAAIAGTRDPGSAVPAPHISALVPNKAVAGSGDLVVNVAGEHFQPGASVVLWNGSARPTRTFQDTTTLLAATIFRRDLCVPGPAYVTVTNVEADRRRSSPPITFDVVPPASASPFVIR